LYNCRKVSVIVTNVFLHDEYHDISAVTLSVIS